MPTGRSVLLVQQRIEPPQLHRGAGEGACGCGGDLLLKSSDPFEGDVGLPLDQAPALIGGGLVPCPGEGVGEDHASSRSRSRARSSRCRLPSAPLSWPAMTEFTPILAAARERAGGAGALDERLPQPKSDAELRMSGDDRYLSLMSLRVFRAGLKHSLVDAKWPAFENAFMEFDPDRVRSLNDEQLDRLLDDRRLIRHGPKIRSVRDNAATLSALAAETGGFGAYLADWPSRDVVGLWADIGKRFKQMGGNSAPSFLRMSGKDTFLITDDVVRALNRWGLFAGEGKSRRDRALIQALFNGWAEETGMPLCQLSVSLALSSDRGRRHPDES